MATQSRPIDSQHAPTCSICIANFNGIGIIDRCLDSIFEQQTAQRFEVIVHDDASTDESVEFIRNRYPGVTLLTTDTNLGFCRSNNRMAELARGRFLLFLNNDAALHPHAFDTLYRYATASDFEGILSLSQYDMQSGSLLDTGSIFDPFLNPVPNRNPHRERVGMVMGACLWIPKTLWETIGGFPDWFDSLAEDLYLCFAAWNCGYQVRALAQSGYDHLVGSSFGGGRIRGGRMRTTKRRRALSERNKFYSMIIFYPELALALILPLHLVLFTLEGLLLTMLKRDSSIWNDIYWQCFRSVWRQRKPLVRERRQAQGKRRLGLLGFARLFTPIPYKLRMLLRYGLPDVT